MSGRRAKTAALAGAAVLVLGTAAADADTSPVVRLKTKTEKEALAKGHLKVRIALSKPSDVRARAKFSAGVSRNFRLDAQTKRVDRSGSGFRFRLSEKQRRILAAAIDVCAPAQVTVKARALELAGRPWTRLRTGLRPPSDC